MHTHSLPGPWQARPLHHVDTHALSGPWQARPLHHVDTHSLSGPWQARPLHHVDTHALSGPWQARPLRHEHTSTARALAGLAQRRGGNYQCVDIWTFTYELSKLITQNNNYYLVFFGHSDSCHQSIVCRKSKNIIEIVLNDPSSFSLYRHWKLIKFILFMNAALLLSEMSRLWFYVKGKEAETYCGWDILFSIHLYENY